jgi:hypothetical protein
MGQQQQQMSSTYIKEISYIRKMSYKIIKIGYSIIKMNDYVIKEVALIIERSYLYQTF